MLRNGKYKAKKSNKYLFFSLLIFLLLWILLSIDLRRIIFNELESFQSTFSNFSSIQQLVDDGHRPKTTNGIFLAPKYITKLGGALIDGLFGEKNSPDGEINLFIKFKHLEKIYSDRLRALETGINKDAREVPCKISDGKNIFKCKVKLKGDLIGHWNSKTRMSFRVRVDNGYIHGLQDFSIQKPSARQFPFDQSFHYINSQLGRLSSNKQGFFAINVNNQNWGIMNVEPTIDPKFVEESGLKRSGVFRISNQDDWAYSLNEGFYPGYFLSDPTIHLSQRGNEQKILQDEASLEIYSYIHHMLIQNDGSIFNREQMIGNLMLGLSWGQMHTLFNANAWYMWNAYEQKLEPILTDQAAWGDISTYLVNQELPFEYKLLFRNSPLTLKEFKSNLSEIKKYLLENDPVDLVNKLKKKYFKNDALFNSSSVFANIKKLEERSEYFVELLNDLAIQENSQRLTKDKLTNDQIDLIDNFVRVFHYLDGKIRIFNLLDKDIFINDIKSRNKIIYVNKAIAASNENSLNFLDVNSDLTGDHSHEVEVSASLQNIEKKSTNKVSLINIENRKIASPNQLCDQQNTLNDICTISGKHYLNSQQLFDKKTVILPGTELFLDDGVDLIFSSVEMLGTKDSPIKIFGNESGGIFIKNKEKESSILRNVNFSGLKTTSSNLRKYTGAVNGYGGIFELDNIKISSSNAEDQLNLINAIVNIDGLQISDGPSDAFDCDFCLGTIKNVLINDIGGDGLDFSGSSLKIIDFEANEINDKALSIGELSNIEMNNAFFSNVSTGIAVKDGSQAIISSIRFLDVGYDHFMTYIKKPFFDGETSLIVNDVIVDAPLQNIICIRENSTQLVINGEYCPISEVNVEDLYSGRMKK